MCVHRRNQRGTTQGPLPLRTQNPTTCWDGGVTPAPHKVTRPISSYRPAPLQKSPFKPVQRPSRQVLGGLPGNLVDKDNEEPLVSKKEGNPFNI